MKFKFFSFFAALIVISAFSSIGFAQENQTGNNSQNSPQIERREKRFGKMGGRMHGHHGHDKMLARMMSELNLSEAQKQQMDTIAENYKNSTEPQKQELRAIWSQKQTGATLAPEQETRAREIVSQMRAAKRKMNDEMLALLTPEQRQQFDQKREEMRQRRQQQHQIRQKSQEPAASQN
jgi:Spy/CpxP family protein refolding chaperone